MKQTLLYLLATISGILFTCAAPAIDLHEVNLRIDPATVPVQPNAVQGTNALTLDDGSSENNIGDNGQFIWLNRFTPAANEYPFQLSEVSAILGTTGVNVGDQLTILVFEDTDGDGDPGTNANLLSSENVTIQFNDGATFNVYSLANPVQLNGPGDVLIGIVNDYSFEGNPDFPAALDQTVSAQRSWAATYLAGDVPANPTLPADEQWGTIDSFGFPGNWVVRGAGELLYSVGGQVTGLTGSGLQLQNNGSDVLAVNANGGFGFNGLLTNGSGYAVTILNQPAGQTCQLNNETGNINGANVLNIEVSCAGNAPTEVPVNGLFSQLGLMILLLLSVWYSRKKLVQ